MKVDLTKQDCENLMFACEAAGRQEGLKAFATMAELASKLSQAIQQSEKETTNGNSNHNRLGLNDGRTESSGAGISQGE